MTVVLVGVGVDDSNSEPYPQVYDDGRFEYLPIPEARQTVEERTYGTLAREHQSGSLTSASDDESTLADVLESIEPEEDAGERYTGDEVAKHPVHYDPNFSALTYGEVKAANRNQIARLDPDTDDVLAFYTGLTAPDSGTPHRYIIGYFTVAEVVDFTDYLGSNPPLDEDGRVVVDELPPQTREQVEEKLAANAANAHAKRYRASGTIDPELMIVDGESPGELLLEAYRISRTVAGGHRFTDEFEEEFDVQTTKDGRDTGWLGGFKKTHRLDISGREFVDRVTP